MNENSHSEAIDLAPLRKWGDEDFVQEMIDGFLRQSEEHVRAVQRLKVDLASLGDAMHSFKASAGYFGAHRLKTVAEKVERLAEDGTSDSLATLLEELELAYVPVKELLEAEIHARDSKRSAGGTEVQDTSGG